MAAGSRVLTNGTFVLTNRRVRGENARMRILVLGASGGCGKWATWLAAADGHAVTALVRPATRFDPPAVQVDGFALPRIWSNVHH